MISKRAMTRSCSGVYAVVGCQIGYTLSPFIFNRVFATLNWSADYTRFDIEKQELGGLLDSMRYAPIRGLNITRPYKELVIAHVDRLDRTAEILGAVNTVALEGKRLVGYNTDVSGVIAALTPVRNRLRGKNAVIFGAGGAARAVSFALLEHFRMSNVTIAARRSAQARQLIHQLQDHMPPTAVASAAFKPASDLTAALSGAALVVNATPVGTGGKSGESLLPRGIQLRSDTVAFDLVYRPRPTRFTFDARRAGCKVTIDGWPMLIAQAESAFRIWTGKRFPAGSRRELLSMKTLP